VVMPFVVQRPDDPTRPADPDRPVVAGTVEKTLYRKAAFHATRLYAGPVGELVSRELLAMHDFGFRVDHSGLGYRLAEHIMAQIPEGER